MADISQESIAARAYALFVRRGRQPGRALDDWLEAERQLKALASAAAHAHPPAPERSLIPGAPGAPKAATPVAPSPSASAIPSANAEAAKSAASLAATKSVTPPPAVPAAKPPKGKKKK